MKFIIMNSSSVPVSKVITEEDERDGSEGDSLVEIAVNLNPTNKEEAHEGKLSPKIMCFFDLLLCVIFRKLPNCDRTHRGNIGVGIWM